MRATLAWLFTLIAGFAAFMGVATLVIIPIQVDKNRALNAKAERYAEKLVAGATPPLYEDHPFPHQAEGARFWHTPPGGCQDKALEAPSDTLVLGFWENGSKDDFGTRWWHCYAYPSGNTTLQLSLADYLASEAGAQVLAYALIAAIAGFIAWWLGSGHNRRRLTLGEKAIWFSVLMTVAGTFDALLDFGDDEFFKNPDYLKWFEYVFRQTLGALFGAVFEFYLWILPIENSPAIALTLFFITLFSVAWLVGRSVALLQKRIGRTQGS